MPGHCKAEEVSILAVDWRVDRLQRFSEILGATAVFHLVEHPAAVITFIRNRHPDMVILPLRWGPLEQSSPFERCSGLQMIDDLAKATFRPEIILFDDQISSLSTAAYCLPFLKGVSALFDERDLLFNNHLKEKIKDFIEKKREKEHKQGDLEDFGLVGESDVVQGMRDFIRRAAHLSSSSVLLTGASGTGKELVAQAIHRIDPKCRLGPFIPVNCSAMSGTLAESEFFGHKRGAFTGADRDRLGYFRAAQGGILFLDEISELDIRLQPKLLRVLQEGRVLPMGYEVEQKVDVRVIAATNKSLPTLVAQGGFRMDLYQRLNVLSLELAELKYHKEDIEPLIYFFLKKYESSYRGRIEKIHPRVLELLRSLDFEGNIREVENLVRKILFRKTGGDMIGIVDLPPDLLKRAVTAPPATTEAEVEALLFEKIKQGLSLNEVTAWCEKLILKKVLQETAGSRAKMAKLLKITIRTLFNKTHLHYPNRLEERRIDHLRSQKSLTTISLTGKEMTIATGTEEISAALYRKPFSDPPSNPSERVILESCGLK